MTVTLIIVITLLIVRLAFLELRAGDLETENQHYKSLVMEWYNYLSDKKYGDDFRLWRQELDE